MLRSLLLCASALAIDDTAPCPFDLTVTQQTPECKAGTGIKVKTGDKLGMRYVGKIAPCSTVGDKTAPPFDKSDAHGDGIFRFTAGKGEVIQGWDQGVLGGLCVGSKAILTVPSNLGYGDAGVPDAGIPGGADLQFQIEVLSINGDPAHPVVHKDEVVSPELNKDGK